MQLPVLASHLGGVESRDNKIIGRIWLWLMMREPQIPGFDPQPYKELARLVYKNTEYHLARSCWWAELREGKHAHRLDHFRGVAREQKSQPLFIIEHYLLFTILGHSNP